MFVYVLLCSLLVTAATPPTSASSPTPTLCQALSVISAQPVVDGIFGEEVSFEWVSSDCAGSSAATSFDSGWITGSSGDLRISGSIIDISLSTVKYRQQFQASLVNNNLLYVNASLEFVAIGVVVTGPWSDIELNISISISQTVAGIDVAAIQDYPVQFSGTLQALQALQTVPDFTLLDLDLFDGSPALVLTLLSIDSLPPATVSSFSFAANDLQLQMADVNTRFNPLDPIPSGLLPTVRGKYLPSSSLPKSPFSYFQAVELWDYNASLATPGLFVYSRASCDGDDCPSYIGDGLLDMVTVATSGGGGECAALTLVNGTLHSDLATGMFLAQTNSSAEILSINARTSALFSCQDSNDDNIGFVGISLRSYTNITLTVPLQPLLADARTIQSMAKFLPLNSTGTVWGTITDDGGGVFTTSRCDIFSTSACGLLLADSNLDATQVLGIFNAIVSTLQDTVDIDFLQLAATSLFSPTSATSAVDSYNSATLTPTISGFMQYFVDSTDGLSLSVARDGTFTLTIILHTVASEPVSNFASTINGFLTSIGITQVSFNKQNYTLPTASQVNSGLAMEEGLLVASIPITNIASPAPTSYSNAQIQSSARLRINIDSFLTQSIFSCAQLTLSFPVHDSPIDGGDWIQACINPSLNSVFNATVAGYVPEYGAYLMGTVSGYTPSLQESASLAAPNFPFIGILLPPLSLSLTCGQATYSAVIEEIQTISNAISGSTTNVDSFTADVRTALATLCEAPNTLVDISAGVESRGGTPTIVFVITLSQIYATSVTTTNTTYANLFDTPRLEVPLIVTSNMLLQLLIGTAPQMNASVVAASAIFEGWDIPMVNGMLQGSVASGSLEIVLDYPTEMSVLMDMTHVTDYGGITTQTAINNTLFGSAPNTDNSSHVEYSSTWYPRAMVTPQVVWSNLKDSIFQLLPQVLTKALDIALPPVANPLYSYSTFGNMLANQTSFALSSPQSFSAPLAISNPLCANVLQQFYLAFNFTVNAEAQRPIVFYFGNAETMADVVGVMNTDLAADAILADYLIAKVYSLSNATCGQFAFYSKFPGLVYQAIIGTNGSSSSQSVFTQATVPVFATWKDVEWLMTSLLGESENGVLSFSQVNSSTIDALIPQPIRSVYPDSLPAMFFPVNIRHTDTVAIPAAENFIGEDSVELSPSANATYGGALQANFSTRVAVVFGGPPIGNGANIGVFTSLTQNYTTVFVPEGNNTFVLTITAQIRSPGGTSVQAVTSVNHITLDVGALILDALEDALSTQVDSTYSPMINISIKKPSTTLIPYSQIRIGLSYFELADGSYIIPFSISIANSNFPYLKNAKNSPLTTRVACDEIAMAVAFHGTSNIANVTGNVNIADVSSVDVKGNATVLMLMESLPGFHEVSSILSSTSNQASYFTRFTANISVQTTLHAFELSIPNFAFSDTQAEDIILEQNGVYFLTNASELVNMTTDFAVWETSVYSGQFLSSLTRLPGFTMCAWSGELVNIFDTMNSSYILSSPLPFFNADLWNLLNTGLVSPFSAAHSTSCKDTDFSLANFKVLLSTRFNQSIGLQATYDDNTITISITMQNVDVSVMTSFFLDSGIFLDDSALSLTGLAGVIPIQGTFSATINLVADIGVSPSNLYVSTSHVTMEAEVDYFQNLLVSAGALSLFLSSPELAMVSRLQITFNQTTDSLALKGSASANSFVETNGKILGELQFSITDLSTYLHNPSYRQPDKVFASTLLSAINSNSLVDIFSQSTTLMSQFSGSVNSYSGTLSSANSNPLPLIGTELRDFITNEINDIVGANRINILTAGLADAAKDVLLSAVGHGDEDLPDAFDHLMLQAFTNLLCDVFDDILLGPCPQVPGTSTICVNETTTNSTDVNFNPSYELNSQSVAMLALRDEPKCNTTQVAIPTNISWTFRFGVDSKKNLTSFAFDLGAGSAAALQSACDLELDLGYELDITLMFSRSQGLRIDLDSAEFIAHAALDIESCSLSGTLGFIGADLNGTGTLMAQFQVGPDTEPGITLSANLNGEVDLGFAGPIAAKLSGTAPDQTMSALPHWQANLGLTWSYTPGQTNLTAPTLTITNGTICLGHLLGNVVNSILGHLQEKILDPLEPFLGPNGILLKELSGTQFLFGRELTVLELLEEIAQVYCSGTCTFDGVEALDIVEQIYQLIETVESTLSSDPDGCGIVQEIGDFFVDFKKQNSTPTITNPPSSDDPVENPSGKNSPGFDPSTAKSNVQSAFSKTTTVTGSFGVTFNILDDMPTKIMALMTGSGDFPLISITIPELTIAFAVQWTIVVYEPPTIELNLGIGVGLTLNVGEIALMAQEIINAVLTLNVGHMFSALAISTENADGSLRWPVQGYIRLTAGLTLDLVFVSVEVFAYIELDPAIAVPDINGNGFVSFDQFYWLLAANDFDPLLSLQAQLTLSVGFGLEIDLCISLIFVKVCTTLFDDEWGPFTILSLSYMPNLPTSPSTNGGTLDVNAASSLSSFPTPTTGDTTPTYLLYPSASQPCTMIDYYAAGQNGTSLSRCITATNGFDFTNVDPSFQFVIELHNVLNLTTMPDSTSTTISLITSTYNNASSFSIGPTSLSVGTTQVGVMSSCGFLSISQPTTQTLFSLTGVPCETNITATSTTSMIISGTPGSYQFPLNVLGNLFNLTLQSFSTVCSLQSGKIECNGFSLFSIPASTRNVKIVGSTTVANFSVTVIDVPSTQTVVINGGSLHNDFFCQPARGRQWISFLERRTWLRFARGKHFRGGWGGSELRRVHAEPDRWEHLQVHCGLPGNPTA